VIVRFNQRDLLQENQNQNKSGCFLLVQMSFSSDINSQTCNSEKWSQHCEM